MAAPVAVAVDGPGDRHHLAALFERHASGHERSAASGGLDDDDSQGEAADQTIAAGKVIWRGAAPGGSSLTSTPALDDCLRQSGVLLRVDHVDAGAQHRGCLTFLSAPRCAEESTPRASPLTTITPVSARPAPKSNATSRP